MSRTGARPRSFRRCDAGGTAIEYALIGAGISIIIVVGVTLIGDAVAELFAAVVAAF